MKSAGAHPHSKPKKQVETGGGARVVNRSNNNSNANGGVAYVNSNNAPSTTNANIGSRLANKLRINFNAVVSQMTKKVSGMGIVNAAARQPVEPHYAICNSDGSGKSRALDYGD